jgi:hypothetical protein
VMLENFEVKEKSTTTNLWTWLLLPHQVLDIAIQWARLRL